MGIVAKADAAYTRKLKSMANEPESVGPFDIEQFRLLDSESDIGAVLVGCQQLAETVTVLLDQRLSLNGVSKTAKKDLIGDYGALDSFSHRTLGAYCFGLITADQFHALNAIRKVRNAFGHSPKPLSFADADIVAKMKAIKTVEQARSLLSELEVENAPEADRVYSSPVWNKPRLLKKVFCFAVRLLVWDLHRTTKLLMKQQMQKLLKEYEADGSKDQ